MDTRTCDRTDELMRQWERTGALSSGELALVGEHVERCPRCGRAHGALLPLLRRDADGPFVLAHPAPGALSGEFTDALMRRLAAAPARRPLRPSHRWRGFRLRLVLAAGAALVAAAGFAVWFWGLRPGRDEVLVRFELIAPEARSVTLVGDFNGWDPDRLPMKDSSGRGKWSISVRLKKGSVYTYNFLMDGRQWVADPSSLRQVDDGFGGRSSLLEL